MNFTDLIEIVASSIPEDADDALVIDFSTFQLVRLQLEFLDSSSTVMYLSFSCKFNFSKSKIGNGVASNFESESGFENFHVSLFSVFLVSFPVSASRTGGGGV